jgi:hypothetical protein
MELFQGLGRIEGTHTRDRVHLRSALWGGSHAEKISREEHE